MKRKILSMVLVIAMVLSICACGGKTPAETDVKESNKSTGSETKASEPEALSLPLCDSGESLTVWTLYTGTVMKDMNEIAGIKKMEEITGVHINWIPVAMTELTDKFGVLMVAEDYPDIIYAGGLTYSGGVEKGVEDGFFADCTELIVKYMPNYYAAIHSDDEIYRAVTTDSGKQLAIYNLNSSDTEYVGEGIWNGLTYRKDMLDAWGLEEPYTIDEWYKVLCTAKDKGVEAPMMIGNTGLCAIMSAWGLNGDWAAIDGQMVYTPMTDGFREYLETMKKWFAEGLIDKNFSSADTTSAMMGDPTMVNANSTFATPGISAFTGTAMYDNFLITNPDVYLQPAPNPVSEKGGKVYVNSADVNVVTGNRVYITATCKNPELAAKWLDFQFSEQGMMLNYYGVEGVSYDLDENGAPIFKDSILHNDEGLSASDALSKYARGNGLGRYNWQYTDRMNEQMGTTVNSTAKQIWSDYDINLAPDPSISMTDSEGAEYNTLYAAISTLTEEYTVNYIMGRETKSFEDYVSELEKYGIETCRQIYQTAYERYLARTK